MSGDLISRSALIDVLRNWADRNAERGYYTAYDMVQECIEVVKERPTAYDVDKVVEQLEEYSSGDVCSRFSGGCPYLNNPDVHCEHCAVMMAIEIVKAGGVE